MPISLQRHLLWYDGSYLAVSENLEIAVWNIKSNFEIAEYPGWVAAIHPNGELMVSIGPDGRLWIWNLQIETVLVILPVPKN